jgi:membrane protease YdiL (CAAX protease family)
MDSSLQLAVNRPFRWRLFLILWAACILAVIAIFPYSLASQGEQVLENLPMSLPALIALQVAQNAVLFAIAAGVGLLLASKIGLGLPFLEGWLAGRPIWEKLPRVALLAAVLGVVVTLLLLLLDGTVFGPTMKSVIEQSGIDPTSEALKPAWWKGLLASFYGGIAEEVLLRLFLLTLLAWLGRFIGRTPDGRPNTAVLWTANILAAILFGLGHLPAAAAMGIPLTAMFVLRTVVLNGLLGLVAGWLYWTRGLEAAIISHFSADIILHVLIPLVS